MKRVLGTILLSLVIISGFSQNETDALRYSQVSYGGTSRFIGAGSAFGAVGADFSTLSQNPAGIGLFRKSEVSISFQFFTPKTESEYYKTSRDDNKLSFNCSNAGIIGVQNIENSNSVVKAVQFGFGFNKLANYNSRSYVKGFNNLTSMLSPYTLGLNQGAGWNEFTSGLFWDTYLINYDSAAAEYYNAFDDAYPNRGSINDFGVTQSRETETWGALNEMVLSGGLNISNKLFIGATLGFPFLRYEEESSYRETDDNVLQDYNYVPFKMGTYLLTKGTGVNFKIGAIAQPTEFLRIGAALHTPTSYFNMTDEFSSTVTTTEYKSSANGLSEYRLTTPLRVQGNIAVLINKMGFLSFDYEWIDYSKSKFRADGGMDDSFDQTNENIREYYQSAHNFRIGTEWNYDQFNFRGGINYSTSPYKKEFVVKNDESIFGYSLGIGYRISSFFIDFAFAHMSKNADVWLYPSSYASATDELVDTKIRNNSYTVSFGFKY